MKTGRANHAGERQPTRSLPAALALASLTGRVYGYALPLDHVTTYSYVAPSDYYLPPPSAEGTLIVYDNTGWSDDGWPPNGRYRHW